MEWKRATASGPKPKLVLTAPKITDGFMRHDMALISPYVDIIPLDLSECGSAAAYYRRLLDALIRHHAAVVAVYFVMARYTPVVLALTKLLRRKTLVFTGGIDATYLPDIDWGALGKPLHRRLFALSMRLADSVIAFSNSSRDDLLQYGKPRRIRTVYLAVDADVFTPSTQPKLRRAVTASYFISKDALLQKGIGPFVQAAALVPEVEFVVHGQFVDDTLDTLRAQATPNVTFTLGRFDQAQYAALLQSAMVYVQASAHEGFGVSLAEGMACGCVPVVSDRYALPETVGGTGYVVPFNDPAGIARAVKEAIAHPEKGEAARQRVREHFTEGQRRVLLRAELEFLSSQTLAG